MSDAAQPEPDELDDAACQRALKVVLDACTTLTLELQTPSKDQSPVARAKALHRVGETTRRTILLSRHIRENPIKIKSVVPPDVRRANEREQVIRNLQNEIEKKADPAQVPDLRLELLERIDSPEFDRALATRPRAELVAELCRDMGLANIPHAASYPRRTPDDVAILQAQAAAPSGSNLLHWFEKAHPSPSPPGRGSG